MPLQGIRVLDLSRLLPGPACTWLLAGMGAQVDRVESLRGDPARHLPPFVRGVGAYFASMSRGKRSLALDLRHDDAVGLLHTLLPHYDVLVEGFRPGVLEAMGLDPKHLRKAFPELIVARLSGFGQVGPWSQRVGHDINYAGVASVLAASPGGPPPSPPAVQASDFGGAMLAATQISAALFHRERTGQGSVIDVALADGALAMMAPQVAALTGDQREPGPNGEVLTGALSVYRCYRCSDGKFLTVGPLEPRFQAVLREHVGEDLGAAALERVFATRPRDAWVELLADACVGPALTPTELAGHPHWQARDALTVDGDVTWVRSPTGPGADGPPPDLGEHSTQILAEAGVPHERIDALRATGVIR